MIRWFAGFVLSLGTPIWAQDLPALYSVTGVAADDVLNLRASPSASGEVIGSLAPDAKAVEVVAFDGDWAVINVDGVAGYAAGRFLAPDGGPGWSSLERPVICSGTEPFWSLAIDPATGSAGFSTPEQPEPRNMAIKDVWPATDWSKSAAVSLPVGLAVLRGADCSDGMSDQRFGIAVDLFLQDAGGLRLTGCCNLQVE